MDYYLTETRLGELKVELEDLKTNKRIEVAKRLKRAKELGDLSENSEYQEARNEQMQVESRIFELEQMIKNAKMIEKGGSAGVVRIGSTVKVEKGGIVTAFTIIGSNETRPEAGLISNESPLGSALIGHSVGDICQVQTPGGKAAYKIVAIE